MSVIYTYFLLPVLIFILKLFSFFDAKVAQGFKVRKNKSWLIQGKQGKYLWFHVSSGEFEYAKPVIRELKKKTNLKILVTYFSPSVVKSLESSSDIDLFVPMPWDTPWHWKEFIKFYNPAALAIARTDTWPNMIWAAKAYGIPSILFSATLSSQSGRSASFWGRLLYSQITKDIGLISAVSEGDKDNFEKLEASQIAVEGDTRYDQVIFRLEQAKPLREDIRKRQRIFIAGSTWPEDENVLFSAFKDYINKGINFIVAPHEPTPMHIEKIKRQLSDVSISLFSEGEWREKSVLIIDKVGLLAELYLAAEMAFVGGSFRKTIHSVMEPLAAGCQTVFGPKYTNNREAIEFVKCGICRVIENTEDLTKELDRWRKEDAKTISEQKVKQIKSIKDKSGVSHIIARRILENNFRVLPS